MPKLAKKMQKQVKEAEAASTEGYEPLPAGWYIATLSEVEEKIAESTGADMWGVVMEDLEDLEGNEQPGKQFTNLVLPGDDDDMPEDYKGPAKGLRKGQTLEEAWANRNAFLSGKIKQFFEAFGYSADSDTEEILGERCAIKLSIVTIGAGKRKGERGNQIEAFDSIENHSYEGSGGTKDDDDF